jgi:hypothetical protein
MAGTFPLIIKSLAARFAFATGILPYRIRQLSPVILGYHRILPENVDNQSTQSGMYVRSPTFEQHMHFLAVHFSVLPFEFLCKNSFSPPKDKPLCVITFDDGWADFFTYAFPVLKKLELPATVFLPTDFIGTGRRFWTDKLVVLLSRKRISPVGADHTDCQNYSQSSRFLFSNNGSGNRHA